MPTAIIISGGVALAAALAWVSVALFPENRAAVLPAVHEQIEYEILPRDSSLADVERGRIYYVQLCALCHGVLGNGNGEFRYRMVPKPASLIDSITNGRTDKELSEVIRDGIAGTAMQGWGSKLNEIQRRQVVSYVRYLSLVGTRRLKHE